jgi:tRNA-specific 2-thiouridylase
MAKRTVLAMSGGVDSSVSAVLLREQGYDVIGLFMRSGATEETSCRIEDTSLPVISTASHKQGCCSASDAADARRVADRLDIPFHALNFSDAFGRIKDYFVDEYLSGRTPNPCVQCNNWLKFGKLWDFAEQVGADFIASGHYARVISGNVRLKPIAQVTECESARVTEKSHTPSHSHTLTPRNSVHPTGIKEIAPADEAPAALLRGVDLDKDQSYVLFGLRRDLLRHVLFPVGSFRKPEIREIAHRAGLRVADKPDSQEICFVPDNDYAGFIRRHRGDLETAGDLVDTTGQVVGHHDGYEQFTIGQRKGLGVAFGSPRHVVSVNAESRRVVVGTRDDLLRDELEATRLNWLVADVASRFQCHAKIRYRHEPAPAEVEVLDQDRLRVHFTEPQFGVTPGQAVVLYDGDRVLGGGWIL